jgi:hypothetical protein
MSSIIIRQVTGQGDFAMPTSQSEAEAASDALETLLSTITWLYFDDARVLILNPDGGATAEMAFSVDTYFYLGDMIPTTTALRAALNTALLGSPDIISIGDINIDDTMPGDIFYHQWPEVEWVDGHNGIVQFQDKVPAGAQILVSKYTRWSPGAHVISGNPVDPHLGKRFHPFQILSVGTRQINLSPWVNANRHRNNFKAQYVWRKKQGSVEPAQGIRGPLAPYSISTANRTEFNVHQMRLIFEPAPSSF